MQSVRLPCISQCLDGVQPGKPTLETASHNAICACNCGEDIYEPQALFAFFRTQLIELLSLVLTENCFVIVFWVMFPALTIVGLITQFLRR